MRTLDSPAPVTLGPDDPAPGRRPGGVVMGDGSGPSPPAPDDPRVERFRSVYKANYGPIQGYCRRRLNPEAADEAVNEVFVVAWRRLDDLPSDGEVRPWLFGVARNVVANASRSDRNRRRLTERLTTTPGATPGTAPAADQQGLDGVRAALGRLSEDDQDLLRMVAWDGLSLADAATVLDCTVNAATIRLHRARRRLSDALEAEGIDHQRPPTARSASDGPSSSRSRHD
ncbi:MAG: RNA polymerase sigma factor [Acidimicrobiales bacterium]